MIPTFQLGQFGRDASANSADDQFFSSVVLLAHADGADAATALIDSSSYARAFVANGNAQIDTAQSKFGGSSALLDGTGDFWNTPNTSELRLTSGDFTLEFWLRAATITTQCLIAMRNTSSGNGWEFFLDSNGSVFFQASGAPNFIQSASSLISSGTWYHIAAVRIGTTISIYIDGVSVASGTSVTINAETSLQLHIGIRTSGANPANGHLDEIRLTAGVGRYTTNFTPPIAPFPNR